MSEFDREAERERLRKQYERDKQKREATERMSELLLQGATMTNAHCTECGDPIFRYDGQEFCATCERPVERDAEEESTDSDGESDTEAVEVTSPSDDSRVVFGDQSAVDGPGDDHPGDGRSMDGRSGDDRTGGGPAERQSPPPQAGEVASGNRGTGEALSGDVGTDETPADGVRAAEASLTRTLVAFSQRAEQADDPRQASEHLQAAREAAEALAALRR